MVFSQNLRPQVHSRTPHWKDVVGERARTHYQLMFSRSGKLSEVLLFLLSHTKVVLEPPSSIYYSSWYTQFGMERRMEIFLFEGNFPPTVLFLFLSGFQGYGSPRESFRDMAIECIFWRFQSWCVMEATRWKQLAFYKLIVKDVFPHLTNKIYSISYQMPRNNWKSILNTIWGNIHF